MFFVNRFLQIIRWNIISRSVLIFIAIVVLAFALSSFFKAACLSVMNSKDKACDDSIFCTIHFHRKMVTNFLYGKIYKTSNESLVKNYLYQREIFQHSGFCRSSLQKGETKEGGAAIGLLHANASFLPNKVTYKNLQNVNILGVDLLAWSKITNESIISNKLLSIKNVSFNPSIIDFKGKTYLVARENKVLCPVDKERCISYYYNLSRFYEMRDDLSLSQGEIISDSLPLCNGYVCTAEDMRFFQIKGDLYVIYNQKVKLQLNIWEQVCAVYIAKVDIVNKKLTNITKLTLPFKPQFREKNWSPLVKDNKLFLVYSMDPKFILLAVDIETGLTTISGKELDYKSSWSFGELKGGTPFVEIEKDRYLSFVHSSVPLYRFDSKMGVFTKSLKYYMTGLIITCDELMQCKPTDIYPYPILDNFAEYYDNLSVIFPAGLIVEKDKFIVSYGLNDQQSGIVEIDRKKYLEHMMTQK